MSPLGPAFPAYQSVPLPFLSLSKPTYVAVSHASSQFVFHSPFDSIQHNLMPNPFGPLQRIISAELLEPCSTAWISKPHHPQHCTCGLKLAIRWIDARMPSALSDSKKCIQSVSLVVPSPNATTPSYLMPLCLHMPTNLVSSWLPSTLFLDWPRTKPAARRWICLIQSLGSSLGRGVGV